VAADHRLGGDKTNDGKTEEKTEGLYRINWLHEGFRFSTTCLTQRIAEKIQKEFSRPLTTSNIILSCFRLHVLHITKTTYTVLARIWLKSRTVKCYINNNNTTTTTTKMTRMCFTLFTILYRLTRISY
jgi:hypothetical protein